MQQRHQAACVTKLVVAFTRLWRMIQRSGTGSPRKRGQCRMLRSQIPTRFLCSRNINLRDFKSNSIQISKFEIQILFRRCGSGVKPPSKETS